MHHRHQNGSGSLPPASWRGIAIFVVLSCALAWVAAAPLWYLTAGVPVFGDRTGLIDPAAVMTLSSSTAFLVTVSVVPSVMMFTPLIAAWVVLRWVEGVRFRAMLRGLGMGIGGPAAGGPTPGRKALRFMGLCGLAILGTVGFVLLSVVVAAAVGWLTLDWDLPVLSDAAAQAGISAMLLAVLQLVQIPVAAVVPNGVLALGEEIGWRGYLLPALVEKTGGAGAVVLSGAVWGLWHSPLILLGYNFERPSLAGVLLMAAGCVMAGAWLSWLRLHTGSVWPAVFAHGALNGAAALYIVLGTMVPADGALAGPLGAAGWIAFGAFAAAWAGVALTRRLRTPHRGQRAESRHPGPTGTGSGEHSGAS